MYSKEKLFNQIYDEYRHYMYRIAYGVLQNKQNAEDAVQDACVRIYKNIKLFQGREIVELCPLITIMTRRAAIDLARHVSSINSKEILVEDKCEGIFSASSDSVVDEIINREDLSGLLQYALKLNETYKETLILRYYYEFSYRDISRLQQISIGNVKIRILRAKAQLATYIVSKGGIMPDDEK